MKSIEQFWVYQKTPVYEIGHKSSKSWYIKWFCKHQLTNHVYHKQFPDIAYNYCDKCEQWLRITRGDEAGKLLAHMFKW